MSGISGKFRSSGFTLIELMIVVALVAIVATIAVPSFSRLIESNRLISSTNDLVGVITFARSEAIRHGRTVTVTPRTVGGVADFENGVEVAVDGAQLRVTPPVEPNIEITSPGAFSFRGNGLASSSVTLKVCNASNEGRQVMVSLGGQVRVVNNGVACS